MKYLNHSQPSFKTLEGTLTQVNHLATVQSLSKEEFAHMIAANIVQSAFWSFRQIFGFLTNLFGVSLEFTCSQDQ